ncbi:DUF2911 domain-containing protein [Fulvivirga lutea]|uniref:DUF2911 domain-containing protein n=1 Tax=Fulvivirga lutea TaxID=2810512 RepID=A0A974WJI7_9BACT|nr:DUF2911 domain-containing protein [Fulvivirga lutea]QSE99109.1 DUF2911 domain-containing protein [Fulvivirga lutea]
MKSLKTYLLSAIVLMAFVTVSCAQKKASPSATAEGTIDGVAVTIEYHQPSAKGRKIMNGLVPYGKVWRTGANDATTIEFSEDVKIEGQTLAKGKYALFTIPNENEWTVIFNKTHKQWGAYNYVESDDALRVKVKPSKTDMVETFIINVVEDGVTIAWEKTLVKFSVSK